MGTNSTRLFIAENDVHALVRPIYRTTNITGLGKGVGDSNRLSAEAMDRTTAVLEKYAAKISEHRVVFVRVAATAAMRQAENAETYLDVVQDILGVRPKIITGEMEARLTFFGVLSDPLIKHLGIEFQIIDIGGGSTEFSRGFKEPRITKSLPLGCVSLQEAFFKNDPPTSAELAAAREHVSDILSKELSPETETRPVAIAVAGTATTLASIELELESYDPVKIHRFKLKSECVERRLAELAAMTLSERKKVIGLQAARADTIVSGAVILRTIMEHLDFQTVIVSERDILDGLAITAAADYNKASSQAKPT